MTRIINTSTRKEEGKLVTTLKMAGKGIQFVVGGSRGLRACRFSVITENCSHIKLPGAKKAYWFTVIKTSPDVGDLPTAELIGREQYDRPATYKQAYDRHMRVVSAMEYAATENKRLDL